MEKAEVRIKSVISDGKSKQHMEEKNAGRYYCKNGINYLRYEEKETSGMEGTVTMLKWTDDYLRIIRHGTYEAEQNFAAGSECSFLYRTPYMRIPLKIRTKVLEINHIEECRSKEGCKNKERNIDGEQVTVTARKSIWRFFLQYELLNGEDAQEMELRIDVTVNAE